ncbi:hypothetical protein ACFLZV_06925 [Candidatus Margulisiibacteriota bacterium]
MPLKNGFLPKKLKDDRGSIFILAVIIMTVIMLLFVSYWMLLRTLYQLAGIEAKQLQVYYAAKGGIEKIKYDIQNEKKAFPSTSKTIRKTDIFDPVSVEVIVEKQDKEKKYVIISKAEATYGSKKIKSEQKEFY